MLGYRREKGECRRKEGTRETAVLCVGRRVSERKRQRRKEGNGVRGCRAVRELEGKKGDAWEVRKGLCERN